MMGTPFCNFFKRKYGLFTPKTLETELKSVSFMFNTPKMGGRVTKYIAFFRFPNIKNQFLDRFSGGRFFHPGDPMVVVHPLNYSQQWNGSQPAVERAEQEKAVESTSLCTAAKLAFIPLGIDTFGAYGSQGPAALAKLFNR